MPFPHARVRGPKPRHGLHEQHLQRQVNHIPTRGTWYADENSMPGARQSGSKWSFAHTQRAAKTSRLRSRRSINVPGPEFDYLVTGGHAKLRRGGSDAISSLYAYQTLATPEKLP